MKIVVDGRMLFASGIGTYLRGILPQFSLDHSFEEFTVLCSSSESERWVANSTKARVARVPAIGVYNPSFWWQRSVRIALRRADVWWAPHYVVPMFKPDQVKLMTTIHDCAHLEAGFSPMTRWIAQFFLSKAVTKSNVLVTVSNFSRKRIIAHFPAAESKTSVIFNGVDPQWFMQTKNESRKECSFLVVGNVKPHKNLKLVFDAFRLLRRVDAELLVVGKMDGFIHGDKRVAELAQLDSRVKLLGSVAWEHLHQLMQRATALIMPSLYEGFSLPPLEALATGARILLSDIPVHRELYQNYATFFPPLDVNALVKCLERVVEEPAENGSHASAAVQYARKFSWEHAGEAHCQLLRGFCNS